MVSCQNIRIRFCFVFTIFSKLSNLKKCTLNGNLYTNGSSIFALTKYLIIRLKRRRKKLSFNWLQRVIFPQFLRSLRSYFVVKSLHFLKESKYFFLSSYTIKPRKSRKKIVPLKLRGFNPSFYHWTIYRLVIWLCKVGL